MLPSEFKDRMRKLLGVESEALFDEIENGVAVRSFRINEIKALVGDKGDFSPEIVKAPMSFPENAYYTDEEHPGSLPCHHAGMIYMQDPSAMATVHAFRIPEGANVLDSCSAPGGKTTQLAAFVGEKGIVVANEYDTKRCRILQSNVERMGCKNTVVVNLDTAVLAETYPSVFDVVLCDAPCSGEGMFRKNELAVGEWSLENVEMCAERQKEILSNVIKCVKSGGMLIYSTCTFSLEENEMNVAWILDNYPEFRLVPCDSRLSNITADGITYDGCAYDMSLCRRFYTHISKGEGQFIALLERACGECETETKTSKIEKKKKSLPPKKDKTEVELLSAASDFLKENIRKNIENEGGYTLFALGGKAYLKPDIALPKYGVFAAGVCVGEMVGKRFVPHHQLFSAFGKDFLRRVNLTQSESATFDYLRGAEISVDGRLESDGKNDGYAAILVDGCPLGGGKISGGVCKNHYPKGLRNQ